MQNNLFRKIAAHVLMWMMVFSMVGNLPASSRSYADNAPPIRILEIQPGTSFQLPSILTDSSSYKVDTMPMKRFIADRQQINGKYDLVYVGNTGGQYKAIGKTLQPTGLTIGSGSSTVNNQITITGSSFNCGNVLTIDSPCTTVNNTLTVNSSVANTITANNRPQVILDGTPYSITGISKNQTASSVATAIRAFSFAGYTTGGTGTVVTFTKSNGSAAASLSYNANGSGLSATPSASYSISVTLDGTVSQTVTLSGGQTAASIAQAIKNTTFSGYTTVLSNTSVTFTKTSGTPTSLTYTPNNSGANGSVSTVRFATITIDGVAKDVSVTGGQSAESVASTIRMTQFPGYVTGGTGATVLFSKTTGSPTSLTYNSNSSGATGVASVASTTATLTLDGTPYSISIAGNQTATQVATAIKNTVFTGYTTSLNGATVAFAKAAGGLPSSLSYDPLNSKTAGTVSYTNSLNLPGNLNVETYSPNDITELKGNEILEYNNSKQMIVFDRSIFEDTAFDRNTILYKKFNPIKSNGNVKLVSSSITKADIVDYYNSSAVVKKPMLNVTSNPVPYTSPTGSFETKKYMEFVSNISGNNRMDINLYIDTNGDGIYTPSELVRTISNIPSGDNYAVNFPVPDTFAGLQPWKIEVVDTTTNAKNYVLGTTAFKATTARQIRVLQVTPDGSNFLVSSLGSSLQTPEYNIIVTQMDISTFNATPPVLDNNYDMVILGFSDSYNNKDFSSASLTVLQNFIDKKRSVLFTHDTMAFWNNLMTQKFRDTIGQAVYHADSKFGWSDPTLDRTATNSFKTAQNAYKINEGLITQYPYVLGDLVQDTNGTYKISLTHSQYFQLDLEDPTVVTYYSLGNDNGSHDKNDPRNFFYMYSKGNITYSGTGHASPAGYAAEAQLFLNTMVKAIRGANNAPSVEVFGITNGQNIMKSSTSFDFSYIVSDLDEPKDALIMANIYMDINNDGTFSPSEKVKTVSVKNYANNNETISLNNVGSAFKIRVEAIDKEGANSFKDVSMTHDNVPGVSLAVSNKNGYLIGDSDTLQYTLSPLTSTLTKNYNTLSLVSTSNSILGIPFRTNASWTSSVGDHITSNLPDLRFTSGASSWSGNKTLNLPVTFTEAREYSISNKLTYVENNLSKDLIPAGDSSYVLRVKEGHIGVDVKNNAKAVRNTTVTITDVNGNPVSYTNDAGDVISNGSAVTGSSGHVTFNKLPSGTYKIQVNKSGYGVTTPGYGSPATVNLSYDNPVVNLEYGPTENLISNVSFKDSHGSTSVATVAQSTTKAKFTFDLQRDTSTLKLLLNLGGLNATVSDIKLGGTTLTLGDDGYIRLPNDLNSGTYVITMNITPSIGTDRSDVWPLKVTSYSALDRDVEGAIEFMQNMPTNALNMKIYKRPKIQ